MQPVFLYAHHFTDANGHVSFSSKRSKVEYSIVWESDKYNQNKDGAYLYDELSGYSIKSLDDNIINFRNVKDVEKYMKNNKPDGITDEFIDKYLESYKGYM